MENLTYDRYLNDDRLRAEMKAAAGRERARAMNHFLRQAAHALLGNRSESERERIVQRIQPCEAC
jgi:hypothetical protein